MVADVYLHYRHLSMKKRSEDEYAEELNTDLHTLLGHGKANRKANDNLTLRFAADRIEKFNAIFRLSSYYQATGDRYFGYSDLLGVIEFFRFKIEVQFNFVSSYSSATPRKTVKRHIAPTSLMTICQKSDAIVDDYHVSPALRRPHPAFIVRLC